MAQGKFHFFMRWIMPVIMIIIGVPLARTHPHLIASFFVVLSVALAIFSCWLIIRAWPSPADRMKQGSLNAHTGTVFGSFLLGGALYMLHSSWKAVMLTWPETSI